MEKRNEMAETHKLKNCGWNESILKLYSVFILFYVLQKNEIEKKTAHGTEWIRTGNTKWNRE